MVEGLFQRVVLEKKPEEKRSEEREWTSNESAKDLATSSCIVRCCLGPDHVTRSTSCRTLPDTVTPCHERGFGWLCGTGRRPSRLSRKRKCLCTQLWWTQSPASQLLSSSEIPPGLKRHLHQNFAANYPSLRKLMQPYKFDKFCSRLESAWFCLLARPPKWSYCNRSGIFSMASKPCQKPFHFYSVSFLAIDNS